MSNAETRNATAEEEAEVRALMKSQRAETRNATPEEEAEVRAAMEARATGGGHPDNAEIPTPPKDAGMKLGSVKDALRSFANAAVVSAGPQVAGAMGAVLHSAANPMQQGTSDLDAYRDVRDQTARQMAESDDTLLGRIGSIPGSLATPIPVKALPRGSGAWAHAKQGAKVGGAVGLVSGAANSQGDLTKMDGSNWGRVIGDALKGGAYGLAGGGASGGALGAIKQPLRSAAENQALKAAGLRGGISNQVQKKLGLSTEEEARELGRKFLDEDLIPFAGSKEAVARRADNLKRQAGNTIGAVLTKADTSGAKFNFDDFADAARAPILDPSKTTAVARRQATKALGLADDLAAQGADTPGSFVGANRAKSDAWQAARFDDDAPIAAQLYRKAVGSARDNLESQVARALGGDDAAALAAANKRFGVGADALKLARNAGTRDQASSTFGLREQLMLAAGLGGGAGAGIGHAPEGLAVGLGGALLNNLARKRGNAALARTADFAANRAASNSGGVVGSRAANALAPYLELLAEEDK